MKTTIDGAGRIVVPKPLRDALGLAPHTEVDVTIYGDGLHVAPGGRTARLVEENGVLVVEAGKTGIDDDDVFRLIDAGRA